MTPTADVQDWHLRIYLREITHQIDAASLACVQFNAALDDFENPETPNDSKPLFAHMQALLSAAAMLSKFLWESPRSDPEDVRAWAKARAARLRSVLEVNDDSPLKRRNVRNSLEHFDDRLDRTLLRQGGVIDYHVGHARSVLIGPDGDQEPLYLRRLDLVAGTISALDVTRPPNSSEVDATVDYAELSREIARVADLASKWLAEHPDESDWSKVEPEVLQSPSGAQDQVS